jgi:hypothetical protein
LELCKGDGKEDGYSNRLGKNSYKSYCDPTFGGGSNLAFKNFHPCLAVIPAKAGIQDIGK